MSKEDLEIRKRRLEKLEFLKKQGINPYPYSFNKKNTAKEIKEKFSKLKKEEKTKNKASIAGRVMASRIMGKISFFTIQDQTEKIQIYATKDSTKEYNIFKKIDTGDFIGVEGTIFKTKAGEITVHAKNFKLLSKSLRPLPSNWHGLKDEEIRYRKRYLDIISNPEIKELFIKKQKFWSTIRNFLTKKGFLEVETPILETSTGGAAATPFITHHNALDLDVFLRISMGELWQKKLLVAGYEKTFEIGRQFRNEGIDMEHLQDYTQMEFYWAYADYKMGMKFVEEMYKKIVKEVLGNLKFESQGHKIDLSKKWKIYDYEKVIKKKTKIDIYKQDKKDIIKFLNKNKIRYDKKVDKWRLVDVLWKHCRKGLSGPGFLVGQPVEIAPLAKRSRENNKKVEQFQVIIAGSEMGNGYSELNDPKDQRERFERQTKLKRAGDKESMEHDKSFIEALEYGMPPACGFGVSERFFSFLMNKPIRECVIFPLMRPEKQ
tara:strand:- start:2460 stop:3926 length:1467 start_codon:yes stop_codon:yes gene_type:complete